LLSPASAPEENTNAAPTSMIATFDDFIYSSFMLNQNRTASSMIFGSSKGFVRWQKKNRNLISNIESYE
jgi:hypothetical protein